MSWFNLVELLFLIFGWVFAIKGLVIACIAVCGVGVAMYFVALGMGGKPSIKSSVTLGAHMLLLAMSIICMCVRF